jgi:hypothetical protein
MIPSSDRWLSGMVLIPNIMNRILVFASFTQIVPAILVI